MISEKASWERVSVSPFVFLHKVEYDIASKWGLERSLGQKNNVSDATEILQFGLIS